MDLVKEMQKWKKDLEELNVEKGKADGRAEQAMKVLKDLGFDSIETAQKEWEKVKAKKLEAEEEARELITACEEKYADFIE